MQMVSSISFMGNPYIIIISSFATLALSAPEVFLQILSNASEEHHLVCPVRFPSLSVAYLAECLATLFSFLFLSFLFILFLRDSFICTVLFREVHTVAPPQQQAVAWVSKTKRW
ncbi:hypothetical protein CEXT_19131 [Caerostris extrusa]|uniref:G-protein coupled receptors family 1 profile domain-containing protein n=1 Tax=Caerostris extrusa TaxID=172846 RepID=A0AAV4P887_CAEEX|nr:hypothetical protein CEXT_19131 [Caerostris extrusa]